MNRSLSCIRSVSEFPGTNKSILEASEKHEGTDVPSYNQNIE